MDNTSSSVKIKENTTSSDTVFYNAFSKKITKYGRITLLGAIPLCFLPALYLWFAHGSIPAVGTILTGWFLIASIYGAEYVMTPISYFPILGVSGTYIAFLSGNIANMRVPCAIVAQEAVGTEAGSNEAEVVATLGMCGSIITNLIVTTVAAIGGVWLYNLFPPIVMEALNYVLPSIFGALFALFAIRFPKFGAFGLGIAMFLTGVVKVIPTILLVPICVFSTMAFAAMDYKKKKQA
ncbi:hypothetical protein E9840_12005 [Tissierella creatinini]|nr:hypothetical protein E9840_12005 [Tissierella creatinini]